VRSSFVVPSPKPTWSSTCESSLGCLSPRIRHLSDGFRRAWHWIDGGELRSGRCGLTCRSRDFYTGDAPFGRFEIAQLQGLLTIAFSVSIGTLAADASLGWARRRRCRGTDDPSIERVGAQISTGKNWSAVNVIDDNVELLFPDALKPPFANVRLKKFPSGAFQVGEKISVRAADVLQRHQVATVATLRTSASIRAVELDGRLRASLLSRAGCPHSPSRATARRRAE
jgi:hypothetical protein